MEGRQNDKTTYFACIWRLSGRLHFLRDIAYRPSDLKLGCEGSRLNGKLRPKKMVGPGIICMQVVNIYFKPLYLSVDKGFKVYRGGVYT